MELQETKLDEKFIEKLREGNLGQTLQYLRDGKISKVEYVLEEDKCGKDYTKYVVTNLCTELYVVRNGETFKREILYDGFITYEQFIRNVWSNIIRGFRFKSRVLVNVSEPTNRKGVFNLFVRRIYI